MRISDWISYVFSSDLLKRVLGNVKTRGTFGEVQLGALLEQVLTIEQYETNCVPVPGSSERVELAVKLPGTHADQPIRLPIDANFPREEYERLMDAQLGRASGRESRVQYV